MTEDIEKQIKELNSQVDELRHAGKFDKAFPIAQKASDLAKKHLTEEHPEFIKNLNAIGLLYDLTGKYSLAEPVYKQVLEIRRQVLGEKHPDYAKSLNNLGVLYECMGDYLSSENYYNQSIATLKEIKGNESSDLARIWNNIGNLYRIIGNYTAAKYHLKQAVMIQCKTPNNEPQAYARSLNNLGIVYMLMGNYSYAESYYKQAMKIRQQVLGEEHYEFANCLNNLGLLYASMGNYLSAVLKLKQALEIKKRTLGEEHPSYIGSLENIAIQYIHSEDYTEAEIIIMQVIEIRRRVLGTDHPVLARSLNSLGRLYWYMGNFSSSESYYKQAIEIMQKVPGERNPNTAKIMCNLGQTYIDMGNYHLAENLLKQSNDIRSKVFDTKHPEVAANLQILAVVHLAMQRKTVAYRYMEQASDIYDHLISQIFSFRTENQRMDYLEKIMPGFDIHLSIVYKYFCDSSEKVNSVLDLIFRRKAISAEASAAQRDAVLSGKYPELKEKLKELTILRTQIAIKELKGSDPENMEMHEKLLSEWNKKKGKLETELVRQIPEMNMEEHLRNADRKAVAKALPEGSILVEFVKFNEYDFKAIPANGDKRWKPARYLAFILPSGDPDNVQMIDLGEAEAIDKLIVDFRTSILEDLDEPTRSTKQKTDKNADVDISHPSGKLLREIVFDKFADSLKGYDKIFIAPDGNISRLPFEVLPTNDGRYLIDDYHISYLSVGRDALRFNTQSRGTQVASLVVADPNFDMGRDMSLEPEEPESEFSFAKGWRKSRDFDRSSLKFDRLPGTRPESESVSNLLKTKSWLDNDVLESKLKAVHSPFIMHLATHGFFLEDQQINLEKESGQRYENPLLRSGLAMAGANTFIKGGTLPDEAEDGILTAEDVSGLDLTETEMVVLSACDTGLGEIRTGEGVFGLRRSFMLAGAKTLVMSLWKIPDLATPILMERFYENLINRKMGRAESLRDAQIYVRDLTIAEIRNKWLTDEMIDKLSEGNDAARNDLQELASQPDDFTSFKDPAYWGAFICQGDPGPIKMK